MAVEFKQDFLEGYCKLEKKQRNFVTHANNPEKVVCCHCLFTTTKEKLLEKEEIPHYSFYAVKKEEEESEC